MRLFYHSIDKVTNISRIGVANSKDGFQWQKNSSGFILDAGPEGSIDDLGVKSPCVARIGRNEYIMFYEALSSKHPGNPPFASRNRRMGSNGNALQPLRSVLVKTAPGTKAELDDRTLSPWQRTSCDYTMKVEAPRTVSESGIGLAVSIGDDMFSFVRRKSVMTAA